MKKETISFITGVVVCSLLTFFCLAPQITFEIFFIYFLVTFYLSGMAYSYSVYMKATKEEQKGEFSMLDGFSLSFLSLFSWSGLIYIYFKNK